jgi:3-hydroxybutyryl-CoA dehydratase
MSGIDTPAWKLAVGERFSRTHTFSPEEARAFASAAGDDNPLHHDETVAADSRFGGLIVSGTHTAALLLGLTASHLSKHGTVLGVNFSVAFKRAVHADETVSLEWVVDDIQPGRKGQGQRVTMSGSLRNQRGDVCVSATGTVLVGIDLRAQPGFSPPPRSPSRSS